MEKVDGCFKEEKWKKRWDDEGYYWQPADKCLYQLFQQTSSKAVTRSKVDFLNRYYGTQLERRKVNIESLSDALYSSEKFKDLPNYLKKEGLWNSLFAPKTNIYTIHFELTFFVDEITGTWETVFASKWLHFHCPHLFPIIDSKSEDALFKHECVPAKKELDKLIGKFQPELKRDEFDKRYCQFCYGLLKLRSLIAKHEQTHESLITPKDLDLYLQTY